MRNIAMFLCGPHKQVFMGADTNAFMLPLFQTAGISPPFYIVSGWLLFFYAVGGSGGGIF